MLRIMRSFPYGLAALALLVLALLSGGYIAARPEPKKKTTLVFWTFAKPHYESYLKALPQFEKEHPGVTVDIQLVALTAVQQRLRAAFWADLEVPDMVETEISGAGSFFRGAPENIGFLDLTDRIELDHLKERMVAPRFSAYTKAGRIYGLPHDVHPVQLAYRRDIFEKEGVDVSKIETWDDFMAVGRKLTIPNQRYMIQLSDTGGDDMALLLFERGGGYFNADGQCSFDDENGVQSMLQYVPIVAGPKKIGNNIGSGQQFSQSVQDGYLLCFPVADWKTKTFETDIPQMSGKMALMPFPAIVKGGRRTSTAGGTMLGITKGCKNQDLAWELAKFLYLSPQDLADRFTKTNIIPPVRAAWALPAFNKPNPYWSNQPLGATFARLAPETPPQYGSPFVELAKSKMTQALVACVQKYNTDGDNGFEAFVRAEMTARANEVRDMMSRTPDGKADRRHSAVANNIAP